MVTSLTSPYRQKYQGWTAGHQLLYPEDGMGWDGDEDWVDLDMFGSWDIPPEV